MYKQLVDVYMPVFVLMVIFVTQVVRVQDKDQKNLKGPKIPKIFLGEDPPDPHVEWYFVLH